MEVSEEVKQPVQLEVEPIVAPIQPEIKQIIAQSEVIQASQENKKRTHQQFLEGQVDQVQQEESPVKKLKVDETPNVPAEVQTEVAVEEAAKQDIEMNGNA